VHDREILRLGRGTANALDWRPDGEVLAVGSGTGIWLYDENFQTLAHLEDEQTGNVQTVKWSADGDRLAAANDVGTLQIWSVADNNSAEVEILLNQVGTSVEWNPNSEKVAVTKLDHTVSIISAVTGAELITIPDVTHSQWTQAGLAWSPDGVRLAIGNNRTIQIWDTVADEVVLGINNEFLRGEMVDWSPDGDQLSALCVEYLDENLFESRVSVCGWSALAGVQVSSLEIASRFQRWIKLIAWNEDWSQLAFIGDGYSYGQMGDPVWVASENNTPTYLGTNGAALAWKPDSNLLSVAEASGNLVTYSVTTAEARSEGQLFTPSLTSIAFKPDGTRIASTGFGFVFPVNIWDSTVEGFRYNPLKTFWTNIVDSVTWTSDGNAIVTFGNNQGVTLLWYEAWKVNVVTGESTDLYYFYSQFETLPILDWNSDFTRLAHSISVNTVAISDSLLVTTGGDYIDQIVWSPDDRLIATVGINADFNSAVIETRNVATGRRVVRIEYPNRFVSLQWRPDSAAFAVLGTKINPNDSSHSSIINVYDLESSRNILELAEPSWAMAWNHQGNLLANYSGTDIHIYNVQSADNVLTIPAYRIRSLSWHPDDTLLAGGSADGTIRIWDVSDLTEATP
jgi:WD40 repeat protein